jgi:oligoendopeptidase F
MSNGRPSIPDYEQKGWDLSELLPSGEESEVGARLAELEERVAELEECRERLTPEMAAGDFLEIMRLYEGLVERLYVLSAYGQLWFSEDTQSEAALTYRNRVEHVTTGLQNRILFLTLWWKGLEDEDAERLLEGLGEHPDFVHFLRDSRRFRPYTLDEPSEKIINLKNANGADAILTLYSMLTNRLEFEIEVDGEARTVTRDQLSGFAFSPDPRLRRESYNEFFRVYQGEANVLGQIFVHRVRDWDAENRELRGFTSALAVRNMANDLPDAAVATLLETIGECAGTFHRYFRMKAGWLESGDTLSRYDLYAPMAASERRVEYGDAVRTVLETLYGFHPEFGSRAERVFRDDHIDSEVRKGKRGGAFCATVLPSQTPWLLSNFNGRVRDVATLAHELGHAVHSLLAEDHSVLTQHSTLPLAETASVFAEILLTDRMLKDESDPLVRRELIAASLDDIYATVIRQACFVNFETRAHEAILAGRSPDELSGIYLDLVRGYFGDAVEVPDRFRWEWVAIPHMYHSPFYCYAYSFGQLLVLALYRRYQEQGESFLPGYLRMLAHGGSARPVEILSEVGIDVSDAGFWRAGFEVVEGMIDELESLN